MLVCWYVGVGMLVCWYVGMLVCWYESKTIPDGTTRSIEGQDSLDDVHGWGVEGLEHNLSHFFYVGFWVQWNWVGESGATRSTL